MSGPADNPPVQPAPFAHDQPVKPAPFQPYRARARRPGPGLRPRTLLTAALLGAAGAAAWFVLTARSVYLETTPAGARIEIHGVALHLADHYLIRAGAYPVDVGAVGYFPLHDSLHVSDEKFQRARFVLEKHPGILDLSTAPVSGASIRVDGKERGTSPAVLKDLSPGTHHLRVEAPRYLPLEQDVSIEGRDQVQKLALSLTPAWAPVTVSSDPAGADILVDDAPAGNTPQSVEILQGSHELRLQLPGYKSWHQHLEITANQPLALPQVKLEVADATVHVESTPSGANVTVNGEYRGQTPLDAALSPGEPSSIRLFREGYKVAGRQMTLKSGEKQSLRVVLEPELARVEFALDPGDARLYVDGVVKEPESGALELTTQAHHVRVEKPGYVAWEGDITPRVGIAQQVRVQLKTTEQVRIESIKPLLRTAAGQTMKLFRPSETFEMGASRREPGRRANEVLHKVRLQRGFYLSANEVTNAEFKLFDAAHSSGALQNYSLDGAQQPVVDITWEQAALYCNWLSQKESLPAFYKVENGRVTGWDPRSTGYRLPTEAEWAWAAASVGAGRRIKFPWGDALPPAPKSGNYADQSAKGVAANLIPGYDDGFVVSAPVGSFAPNGKGLFDLGGNVAEWVNDYHDIPVDQGSVTDPLGPASGEQHVIRGASWAEGGLTELRLTFRDYGLKGRNDVGFRIARYVE